MTINKLKKLLKLNLTIELINMYKELESIEAKYHKEKELESDDDESESE